MGSYEASNYEQLVKALRDKFIAYDVTGNHNSAQLYKDAAAAIEALQAEVDKREGLIDMALDDNADLEAEVDALKHDIGRYVGINAELTTEIETLQAEVKKAAKRNTELHAELEKWVSAAEMAGLVVRCKECIHFTQGGWCDREFDWFPVDENDFCSMAEKMEAQE